MARGCSWGAAGRPVTRPLEQSRHRASHFLTPDRGADGVSWEHLQPRVGGSSSSLNLWKMPSSSFPGTVLGTACWRGAAAWPVTPGDRLNRRGETSGKVNFLGPASASHAFPFLSPHPRPQCPAASLSVMGPPAQQCR